MNRERHAYWATYIADLQERMLLADWKIVLSRSVPESKNHLATVSVREGTHEALVALADNFEDETRQEQRRTIVHELVHCHVMPFGFHLKVLGGNREDEATLRVYIDRSHNSHEEFIVDQLARIIAPAMPLPPKVKA